MKYTKLDQIFQNGVRIVNDFSNADLSGLDLSEIPPEMWKGAKFNNTNFRGTNIKFYPRDLRGQYYSYGTEVHFSIVECDFSNCTLLPWKAEDLKEVNLFGSNFYNSNLMVDFSDESVFFEDARANLNNCILPTFYYDKPVEYWDNIIINAKMLEKNPEIHVSSGKLLEIIRFDEGVWNLFFSELDYDINVIEKIIDWLECDYEGKLKRLYNQLEPYFKTELKKMQFFEGKIRNLDFGDLDLSYVTPKMWSLLSIYNCYFDSLKIGYDYKTLNDSFKRKKYSDGGIWESTIEKLQMPITIKNWDNNKKMRLGSSSITYQTNLYLELKRVCNMKCKFCRNEGLDHSTKYDYDEIINNLVLLTPHLNNVVVGGGEPTLLLDDLRRLPKDLQSRRKFNFIPNLQIITNGSLTVDDYWELSEYYSLIISRHAIDDEENRMIFGDKNNLLLNQLNLEEIAVNSADTTLCCTCFKGGVDSKEKMLEYLKFAQELGFFSVLIQTLHQEDNFIVPDGENLSTIDESVIRDTLSYLENLGYSISKPIYSMSGYELHIAKYSDFKITFKEYKDPVEIANRWNLAPKRCFDLSMAPNGDVYETWNQQGGPIKIKR